MTIILNTQFFYYITGSSMVVLTNEEGDVIIRSRDIGKVAKKIIDSPEILNAYEQDMVNIDDHLVREDLDKCIQDMKLSETLKSEDF